MGIPRNMLDVLNDEFYIPKDMQSISGVGDLSDGKSDAVGLLFSDEDLYQYPTYLTDPTN